MPGSFDPSKLKTKTTYNLASTLLALAANPSRKRLYAGGDDYAIHVFDLASDKKDSIAQWRQHENYVSALVHLEKASRNLLVSGSYDRRLIWWDTEQGKPVREVQAHAGWVRDLVGTTEGKRLISVGDDMLVKLWDAETGQLIRTCEGHSPQTPQGFVNALYAAAIAPDDLHFASADRIGTVRIWETATGRLVQSFEVPILYTYDPRQRKRSIGGIRSVRFSPDGRLLAVGGIGQVGNVDGLGGLAHIEIWDWRKPERLATGRAEGHKAILNDLQFHPTQPWLLAVGGGSDNAVLAWWKIDSLPGPAQQEPLAGKRIKTEGHLHRAVFEPTAREVYTAGFQKLFVWDLAT